ncbi:Bacteriophage N4 adsorption B [Cinnamomum micranthum f. kanehirae]|uniref:Bacteriophage N4 adsorption B n=1 Tax=Cinnamomum micranthum f. kanehirae TaxID=337451 RepID=A0A443N2S2_9MAGN|nr:Bacteriophage N4 adsorption B [Cinnamomum micranthum f. kanehirae]
MPTFTAIALDRLLEPRPQNSVSRPFMPKPDMQNSSSEKKTRRAYVSPALYTTPEATPLPDSPVSFPPSPYIVDHKRRGPRLLNNSSRNNVVECQQVNEEEKVDEKGAKGDGKVINSVTEVSSPVMHSTSCEEVHVDGYNNRKPEDNILGDGVVIDDSTKSFPADLDKDCDTDDFFDPQDVMSASSNTEVDDNTMTERSWKPFSSPFGEYFDAYEELSIEGTPQSRRNVDFEMCEIRTNLLMEIERRKQAEEALYSMQSQWQRLARQLSVVGLSLPVAPAAENDGHTEIDPAEELCQQVFIAQVVANSVGRGAARAEVELEMESHIEAKNIEINRLCDRLHYYETVNREMSQRNQETVERARQQRHRRKRKQKWIWSSIGVAIALGSAALAWSYLPTAKESISTSSDAPAGGAAATSSEQTE